MCLGEGTGAAASMVLYDMGLAVYRQMGTFDDIHVEVITDPDTWKNLTEFADE